MAKNTNAVTQAKGRMKELLESRAAELRNIQERIDEARTQREAAALAIKAATENTDISAYVAAKAKKAEVDTTIEMYTTRYDQLQKLDFVAEEDSNAVINGLLAYEDQIAADLEAAMMEPLKALDKLYADYMKSVRDTEATIVEWTSRIRPNYSTRGRTVYADGTDRSPVPVPVRTTPYEGCGAAVQLGVYLEKAAHLYKD